MIIIAYTKLLIFLQKVKINKYISGISSGTETIFLFDKIKILNINQV